MIRDDGATVEILARNLAGLQYTDTAVTGGALYKYQVAAVVDGGAPTRSTLVEVVAGVANQPPLVVGTLPDRTLQVGTAEVVDVAGTFSDLDDALTYAASSSNVAAARVSVSGSRVTVTPVAPGRTTITVTATETGGSNRSVTRRFRVLVWTGTGFDYDADDDGLIEIVTLEQLDAVRHDLDGDGVPIQSETAAYAMAFPAAATGMGCPSGGGCTGYELETDLDFDTNGDGRVDAGDEYWEDGKGWEPIGVYGFPFRAIFEGNGHTIRNLFTRRSLGGLFGGNGGVIRRVGLIDVDVSGTAWVGGLVAENGAPPGGEIHASYVTGRVAGRSGVGGLVGASWDGLASRGGTISTSYSTARVTGTYARAVSGGLVGVNRGAISASYATGRVSGGSDVGGLIGVHCGSLAAGYATGSVSGGSDVGGLVGSTECSSVSGVVTASYWDSGTSGHGTGTGARTTAQLQAPTGYSGIYSQWNVDLDGDGTNDEPWDFGTGSQYPALKMNFDGQGAATWQEFGRQIRSGPSVTATVTATATAGQAQADLTWTAVDVSHWSPPPDVTYAVTRDDGSTVEVLTEDLGEFRYTDPAARTGTAYTYGVAAVVDGGEAVRSALVVVNTPGNAPPVPVGTLPDRWLHVGDAAGVEIGEAFEDPEDDALTYAAASSAAGVAGVSVSGTRVTITPAAAGTATITVTATDAGGSTASTTQTFTVTVLPSSAIDYDTDDDGLIEITSLRQLHAVSYDYQGDGDAGGSTWVYEVAFPTVDDRQACGGLTGCVGYELEADLDFDTNGNGRPDKDDAYWRSGRGWRPLWSFPAVFEGNGHTIANLFIIDTRIGPMGLFGRTGPSSVIRHVGLIGVAVSGGDSVGGLVGDGRGSVIGSYVTGTVSGTGAAVGGLVGENHGSVVASYAAVEVTGGDDVGGLVGANHAAVTASYATGRVAGGDHVGGLVGRNGGTIAASYATGPVAGAADAGGLVGSNQSTGATGTATASYWDTTTSGRSTGTGGQGRNTAALQAPTGYSGIYSAWNVDLDGDGAGDSPWHFGTNAQYPALAVDADGVGGATWQELGHQLRAGPTLTVTADGPPVALSWTAVDTSAWTPPPAVTYAVYRAADGTVERLAADLTELGHTDATATAGDGYTYQVAAAVSGGEATRSGSVTPGTPSAPPAANRAPVTVGTLPAQTLPIAGGAVTVNVSGAFSDADGDGLTYGVVSSVPAVAAVSVSGSVVTLTPLAAGTSTVTVTATDPTGSNTSATQTFGVTVPNRSPVAVGTLSAQTLPLADGAVTVEVSGRFSDPDGDPLTYAAAASAPGVATVEMGLGGSAGARGSAASTLTLTPLAAGETTVTVTATDAGGSGGTATQSFSVTVQNVDYDADDDGLIEIVTLAQLDAVRHDLDGDGAPAGSAATPGASAAGSREALATGAAVHAAAFPDAAEGMGCPAAACLGYELAADLDFDTDGSGAAGPGDAFWNGGAGWRPLGTFDEPFTAVFSGNGRTVSHLFVGGGDTAGLFGMSSGVIRGVGVVAADVTGSQCAGGLVGLNGGRVEASYATGVVTGDSCVGGLVGVNGLWAPAGGTFRPLEGSVTASWSAAEATAEKWVGGLVGYNNGMVAASYATGAVTATTEGSGAGGLVGRMGFGGNRITASYATGVVSGPGGAVGGLVGHAMPHDRVEASYWDTETSGVARGGGGSGRTTAALQEPTGYSGPYADWDVDVDGDGAPDAPWDFGTPGAYPALSMDVDGDGVATWRELGSQGRTVTPPAASGAGAASGGAAARRRGRTARAGGATARAQAGGRAAPAAFTDDPLVPGVTPVRAAHLLELRSRIDGLRVRAGLPAFGWTDAQVEPGVTPARALHLTELRSALGEAYAAAGRSAPGYTDAAVKAGATAMRAVQLQELRLAVVALEGTP